MPGTRRTSPQAYAATGRLRNGRLRDELLNCELFLSLEEARWVIDQWQQDYNDSRPHSALDYQTPAAYAASLPASVRATPSLQQASCNTLGSLT